MKKNTEIVSGLVNEEHPFHQVQTQPGKAKNTDTNGERSGTF